MFRSAAVSASKAPGVVASTAVFGNRPDGRSPTEGVRSACRYSGFVFVTGDQAKRELIGGILVDRPEAAILDFERRGAATRIEGAAKHASIDLDDPALEPRCDAAVRGNGMADDDRVRLQPRQDPVDLVRERRLALDRQAAIPQRAIFAQREKRRQARPTGGQFLELAADRVAGALAAERRRGGTEAANQAGDAVE